MLFAVILPVVLEVGDGRDMTMLCHAVCLQAASAKRFVLCALCSPKPPPLLITSIAIVCNAIRGDRIWSMTKTSPWYLRISLKNWLCQRWSQIKELADISSANYSHTIISDEDQTWRCNPKVQFSLSLMTTLFPWRAIIVTEKNMQSHGCTSGSQLLQKYKQWASNDWDEQWSRHVLHFKPGVPCSCEMWKTCWAAAKVVNKTRFTPHNIVPLLESDIWGWIVDSWNFCPSSLDSRPELTRASYGPIGDPRNLSLDSRVRRIQEKTLS